MEYNPGQKEIYPKYKTQVSLFRRYQEQRSRRVDYLSELSRGELVPYVMHLEEMLMFLDDNRYMVGSHLKADLQQASRKVRDWIDEEDSG